MITTASGYGTRCYRNEGVSKSGLAALLLLVSLCFQAVCALPAIDISDGIPEELKGAATQIAQWKATPPDSRQPLVVSVDYSAEQVADNLIALLGDEPAEYPGLEIINHGLSIFTNISIEAVAQGYNSTKELSKHARSFNFPTYNEHTITGSGTWWTEWIPSSCVYYNKHSDGNFTYQVSVSHKANKKWDAGIDISFNAFTTLVAKAGYAVTEELNETKNMNYIIPAGSVGQEWYQYESLWTDFMSRKCGTPPYKKQRVCNPGATRRHTDTPLKKSPNVGWSTGYDKVKPGVCGP